MDENPVYFNNLNECLSCGIVKRCSSVIILNINIGAGFQENLLIHPSKQLESKQLSCRHLYNIDISVTRCKVKRRRPRESILSINIGAGFQENLSKDL